MSKPFLQLAAVNFINKCCSQEVEHTLQAHGFRIFKLDGARTVSAESFFLAVKESLPLSPDLSGRVNWDALVDSLFEGLSEQQEQKFSIVWSDVDAMLSRNVSDFFWAVHSLYQVALDLNSPRSGLKKTVELTVVLLGTGDNFPTIESEQSGARRLL